MVSCKNHPNKEKHDLAHKKPVRLFQKILNLEKSKRLGKVDIIQKKVKENFRLKVEKENILEEVNKEDIVEFGVIVHGNLLG